jgi:hypothetical protein
MPTTAQKTSLSAAIDAIRSAEGLLTAQIRNAPDSLQAIKLAHEYNNLDSFLSGLLHLQNLSDDATFSPALAAFKNTAASLKADQDAVSKIVNDVKIAAQVVTYIGKAAALVARL